MEIKAPMGVITSNNNNSFSTREEVEHVICKYIVSNRLMCRGVYGYGARSKISWSMSMVIRHRQIIGCVLCGVDFYEVLRFRLLTSERSD